MPRLSREERLIALGMIQANRSYSEVARNFGCTRRTISNLVERNAEIGSVDDRPRSARERVTTPEQDLYINLLHLQNRFRSASRTARETPGRNYPRISSSTVRRCYASVIYAVEDQFVALSLHRYVDAEDYYQGDQSPDSIKSLIFSLTFPDVSLFQDDTL